MIKEKKLAPVALFVYNRLDHTMQTLITLSNNHSANNTDIFIFCDNCKSENEKESVDNVRKFVRSFPKDSFKSITIEYSEKNKGLASSIITGVTKIVNTYGKIIVVEDDLVTNSFFLEFMNNALDFYENRKKVFHIGGWAYPINFSSDKPFLWRTMNCWGWATWSDRWSYFEKDSQKLIDQFNPKMIKQFNLNGAEPFWQQVIENHEERINTWAIFWYASIFINKGFCLNPTKSLVSNIGFDGSGTHCKPSSIIDKISSDKPNLVFPEEVQEDFTNVNQIINFYKKNKKNIIMRLMLKLSLPLSRIINK